MAKRIARVLRLDAAMELLLAVGCVAVAVLPDPSTLPWWFSRPLAVTAAILLVIAALALLWLARRPDPVLLRAVAVANAMTAVVALLAAALGLGADAGLRIGLTVAAIGIAGLAGVELAIVRAAGARTA
jgi:hypothetical protein